MGVRVGVERGRGALVALVVLVATVAAVASGGAPAAAAEVTTVSRVSVTSTGEAPNNLSREPFTDKYGRFQGFTSVATNLAPSLIGANSRVYLRDRLTDAVELISVGSTGAPATNQSAGGAVTPDGRYVAFSSYSGLVPQDTNGVADVYVRDRRNDTVELISVSSAEALGDGSSAPPNADHTVDISDDGRYVVFSSVATTLVNGDTNGKTDVFRRDRTNGTTLLISVNGALRGDDDSWQPTMSADGRYIAFTTSATNLMANDTNGAQDVIRRDLNNLDSVRISWGQAVNPAGHSANPSISDDGTRIAFASNAPDVVAGDTNGTGDVFVRNVPASTTTRVSTTTAGAQLVGHSYDPSIRPDGSGVGFYSGATNVPGDTNGKLDVYTKVGATLTVVSRHPAGGQSGQDSADVAVSNQSVMWSSTFAFSTSDVDAFRDVWSFQQVFVGPHPALTDFVAHQLTGFTGSASAPIVNQVAARLRNGASPEHWVLGLAHDPVFSRDRGPVTRLYWSFFERRPDKAGLQYWLDQRAAGVGLNSISQKFSQSPEFKTLYGNTTNTDFVKLVYQNVLDRIAEGEGLAYWVGRLNTGLKRGDLMVLFSESAEGKAHMAPYVDTILLALGMYDAIPSNLIFDAIVDAITNHDQPSEIAVTYILGAPEYATAI